MFEGQGRGDVLIRVAVDTMGGDFGPPETVKGALEGLDTHNIELLLVGDQNLLESELAHYDIKNKPVKVVASVGKIGDDEHPIEGLRRKPKSSIVVATKLLKSGDADLLVSMGSTGASMASSVFILGLMDGLERPCIGGPFLGVAPRTVLVDMGSNHLNFIGNVEGMDFFTGRVDVIVCDGFVGNILMKFTEGLGTALSHYVEQRLADHLPAAELAKVSSDLWETTNMPRTMGGPLFGVNGMVMLGHGSCRASGIAGAIHTGVRCAQIGMVESMRQELAQLSGTEVLKN